LKDRLIVTISDTNSTKSYNISKVIKKVIIYAVVSILLIISISFWFIKFLNTKVDNLSNDIVSLNIQGKSLKTQNDLYNIKIKDKIKDIKALGDTLKNMEMIIGVKGDDEKSLINRATFAKLTLEQKTYMLRTIPSGKPLKKIKITANIGWRIHPILKIKKFHNGIDLRAKRKTDVFATADGVVRYVQTKNKSGFGRTIIISHNFGFETLYGHLRFVNVKVGDVVMQGQLIAKSGNSGRSTGPHLHYEVRYASKILDPKYFLKWTLTNYNEIFEKQRRVNWDSLIKMINSQHQRLTQQ
jgi:murein DD-endopeptidase MepM/ murein hydrolase activator NlpD